MSELDPEKLVTVCEKCMHACCWQGSYMCAGSHTVGTTVKTVRELRELHAAGKTCEHEDYWIEGDR